MVFLIGNSTWNKPKNEPKGNRKYINIDRPDFYQSDLYSSRSS